MTTEEFYKLRLKQKDHFKVNYKDGFSSNEILYSEKVLPEIPEREDYLTKEKIPKTPERIVVIAGTHGGTRPIYLHKIQSIEKF